MRGELAKRNCNMIVVDEATSPSKPVVDEATSPYKPVVDEATSPYRFVVGERFVHSLIPSQPGRRRHVEIFILQ